MCWFHLMQKMKESLKHTLSAAQLEIALQLMRGLKRAPTVAHARTLSAQVQAEFGQNAPVMAWFQRWLGRGHEWMDCRIDMIEARAATTNNPVESHFRRVQHGRLYYASINNKPLQDLGRILLRGLKVKLWARLLREAGRPGTSRTRDERNREDRKSIALSHDLEVVHADLGQVVVHRGGARPPIHVDLSTGRCSCTRRSSMGLVCKHMFAAAGATGGFARHGDNLYSGVGDCPLRPVVASALRLSDTVLRLPCEGEHYRIWPQTWEVKVAGEWVALPRPPRPAVQRRQQPMLVEFRPAGIVKHRPVPRSHVHCVPLSECH